MDMCTSEKLEILQHALGLDKYGEGSNFRNHFMTGPGSIDYPICKQLVELGLMQIHIMNKTLTGSGDCFCVTQEGVLYVSLNSPVKPKLKKSQKNYQDFLSSDGNLLFGEWLRFRKNVNRIK